MGENDAHGSSSIMESRRTDLRLQGLMGRRMMFNSVSRENSSCNGFEMLISSVLRADAMQILNK